MNNRREKNMEDFNQSVLLSSTVRRPLQTHDFMPMPPAPTLKLNVNHQGEEARNPCLKNQLKQKMDKFWKERVQEIREAPTDVRVQHTLPLARVKKVMKSNSEVKMISADTPVLFAKACELLIMEIGERAWTRTQENKRRTLQRNDVAHAIRDEPGLLLFLKDMVPLETTTHPNSNQDEAPPTLENSTAGMYVPLPPQQTLTHPIYHPNNFINPNEVAMERGPVETDHMRLPFPMNFQYTLTPDYFTRLMNEETQEGNNHVFAPTPAHAPAPAPAPLDGNGSNPYFPFKDFLQ
ncbi:hypothetical protein ABFX02_08G067900 [Erythranthe guttata]